MLDRDTRLAWSRREFFTQGSSLGAVALASLLNPHLFGARADRDPKTGGLAGLPHFAPKAKRVIFLHQSGGPSQIDTFDYKPQLSKLHGTELPDSVRRGQRITGMTAGQDSFPCVQSLFSFKQHGQSGAWVSELLPWTAKIVDDICIIRTTHTEAINHDPAITFIQSGSQQPGRPSMGAWVSYGLGSENQDLPAYVVMLSQSSAPECRPAAVFAAVGARLSAFQLPGRTLPLRPGASALPGGSSRH
jgi:hypothetical protein